MWLGLDIPAKVLLNPALAPASQSHVAFAMGGGNLFLDPQLLRRAEAPAGHLSPGVPLVGVHASFALPRALPGGVGPGFPRVPAVRDFRPLLNDHRPPLVMVSPHFSSLTISELAARLGGFISSRIKVFGVSLKSRLLPSSCRTSLFALTLIDKSFAPDQKSKVCLQIKESSVQHPLLHMPACPPRTQPCVAAPENQKLGGVLQSGTGIPTLIKIIIKDILIERISK